MGLGKQVVLVLQEHQIVLVVKEVLVGREQEMELEVQEVPVEMEG